MMIKPMQLLNTLFPFKAELAIHDRQKLSVVIKNTRAGNCCEADPSGKG